MSTGIPVVSTECIPRCLRIEGGCFIVPIGDAEALAEAMMGLMMADSRDGRLLSGQVKGLASPEVVGKKLDSIFRGIVDAR